MQTKIVELTHKVNLLDQYCLTLERQNLAKNTQTETLYRQLHEIRMENQIFKNHLDKLTQKSVKSIEKIHLNQVRCSVEFDSLPKIQIKNFTNVLCQTEQIKDNKAEAQQNIHDQCIEEAQRLINLLEQKQIKLNLITKESNQMFELITRLQNDNDSLRSQTKERQSKIFELEYKNKQKSQQLRNQQQQNNQLRTQLQQLVENKENYEMNLNNNNSKINTDRESVMALSSEVERLIKDNNKLIEKVRMLEKEKNMYYKELRTVSPLRKSHITENRFLIPNSFIQTKTNTVIKTRQNNLPFSSQIRSNLPFQSDDKRPKFSDQFSIGRQKEKLKSDRWKMIEDKLKAVKSQNQSLKNNLYY